MIEFNNTALDKVKIEIAQKYGFSVADCRIEFYVNSLEKRACEAQATDTQNQKDHDFSNTSIS